MNKKRKKKWPWILLAIVVVIAAAVFIVARGALNRLTPSYQTYAVAPGSIEVSVTGSGTLAAGETLGVEIPAGVKVREVLVKAGDVVEAGQALAVLDMDSLQDAVATLTQELSTAERQLSMAANSLTQETVTAGVKGRVKYLPVAEGEDVLSGVAQYGALALLSTDELMKVELAYDGDLVLWTEVRVAWDGGEDTGVVAAKTAAGYVITLPDDEAPYAATASISSGDTLLGTGTLSINAPVAVFASGGTISDIHVDLNDTVKSGTKLLTLEDGPYTAAYRQAYAQRREVADQLQLALVCLADPTVTASESGTVRQVLVEDGKTATAAGGETTVEAFVLDQAGALLMSIAVDELDIGAVQLGQTADITLDAISTETFKAEVTHISYLGEAKGNITTYAVELTLEEDARFLPGMNGSAVIIVNEAKDVLLIPVAAINEDADGAYVYVSPSGSAEGTDRTRVNIETGLSDGTYAQVTSGLSQGDVVLYAVTASDQGLLFARFGSQGMGVQSSGTMPSGDRGNFSAGGGPRD